jgi:hypothetical protein
MARSWLKALGQRRSVAGPVHTRPTLEALEDRWLLSTNVLTYHNDNARTGGNLQETVLTPANVNSGQFGKLFSVPVDGQVYGQPLYLENVAVPGQGTHNVVYVATEHDSVYAFDADHGGAPLWQDSFINPAAGVTPIPSADCHCDAIAPEIGITSTPVIDPASGTLYVVGAMKTAAGRRAGYVQKLFALDVATGAEKVGDGVSIKASMPGTGDGGSTMTFSAKHHLQRAALLLLNGVVYVSFTSHCDIPPNHGWVMGYDARTLRRVSVFNTSPDGQQSTIWQSGAGPAADAAGQIYFITGNGSFDANAGGRNFGDSFVKLRARRSRLRATDYFSPFDQARLAAHDLDLGSGGLLLLPDQPGTIPHLLVGAGKEGTVYLLNRDHLGRFHRRVDQVVQELTKVISPSYGSPAYFDAGGQRWIYYGGEGDVLKAFPLVNGLLAPTPSSISPMTFFSPGATPSISANGTSDGILWVLCAKPSALFAFDATNLGVELYDSTQAGTRDQLDKVVRFTVPTVADGKVFVGTQHALTVYGERSS